MYSPMCIYDGKNNSGGKFRFESSIIAPLIVYNTNWTTKLHRPHTLGLRHGHSSYIRDICPFSVIWTRRHRESSSSVQFIRATYNRKGILSGKVR